MSTQEIIEKIYFGWLGKLIGVRLGAPVEMWTHEQIMKKYGEKHGYLVAYPDFAADDDSNGPVFFIRALTDSGSFERLTSADVGRAWVDYAARGQGMYWWGGYGVSSEHTAYENMRAGILPPASGSAELNGQMISEQIGGQIFIDAWGLVCPGRPREAARLASVAARVAHDGEAVIGGQYVAACIAAAFTASSVRDAMETALSLIEKDSAYARCVRRVICFHDAHPDDPWDCLRMIQKDYWRDHFGGNCHIIPNAAIMALAMCYGEDDFDRTLELCNRCGFDTDCNAGNVGTIMGVLGGLSALDSKWLLPINDQFVCSSALGSLNIRTASNFALELARCAMQMGNLERDEELLSSAQNETQSFLLPGATGGFLRETPDGLRRDLQWRAGALLLPLDQAGGASVLTRTYFFPSDFADDRYSPSFSPLVYPGQSVSLRLEMKGSARAYAILKTPTGEEKLLGEWQEMLGEGSVCLRVPPRDDVLIRAVGVQVQAASPSQTPRLLGLTLSGAPCYTLHAEKSVMEEWAFNHAEIAQFSHAEGVWRLENGRIVCSGTDVCRAFTGRYDFSDTAVSSRVYVGSAQAAGIMLNRRGVLSGYAVWADKNGVLTLTRDNLNETILAKAAYHAESDGGVALAAQITNGRIRVFANGSQVIDYKGEGMFAQGCVGLCVKGPGRASFDGIQVTKDGK